MKKYTIFLLSMIFCGSIYATGFNSKRAAGTVNATDGIFTGDVTAEGIVTSTITQRNAAGLDIVAANGTSISTGTSRGFYNDTTGSFTFENVMHVYPYGITNQRRWTFGTSGTDTVLFGYDDDGQNAFDARSKGYLMISTGGASAYSCVFDPSGDSYFNNNGNVGIGDITPQAELDIAGELALAIDLDTTSAPAKAGIIGIDSGLDVYVSTGTGASAWVKIGGQ